MKNFDKKIEKRGQLQVGMCDADLVLLWRKETDGRNFGKTRVIKIMLNWWLSMNYEEQKEIYHLKNNELSDYLVSSNESVVKLPSLDQTIKFLQRHSQVAQEKKSVAKKANIQKSS